jgi:hypothetical protein
LKRCSVDQAVFYRKEGNDLIVMAVHVDDCTIATSSMELMGQVKLKISSRVQVVDMGPIHWMLGLEVTRNRESRTISLSQSSYINSIIRRFHFDDLKPVSTPMEPHANLSIDQCPKTPEERAGMKHIQYRECVGSLMYAALGTRPDITFAVAKLSKFLHNPGMPHFEAVKRVFRYLKGTRDLRLTYGITERELTGWVDADGSMEAERRAIMGFAYLIDGAAVTWNSKQQELVALSTTEAEYVAATHAAKEGLWI